MVIQCTGGHVDEDQVRQVMKECDEDGNGVIDELEFVSNTSVGVPWLDCLYKSLCATNGDRALPFAAR